jgi:TolB-like protein
MRHLPRMFCAAPLLATVVIAACAPHASRADALTQLHAARDRQPGSAAVHRSLGIALYDAGRILEARLALAEALRLDPRDGTTALYLGMAAERAGDLAAARDAYSSYIRYGRTRRLRSQLESRLAALQRSELHAAVRSAIATEGSIAGVRGDPRVIAVMPFAFSGADGTLQPLERGFAELVTTDLARSGQLTLVERARLQAILNELAVQQSGAVDGASSVRVGRLLQAGRIVQGGLLQVDSARLRVDAAIVDVPTTHAVGAASGDDRLDALFDLEKRLVLDLFEQLGVTLTAAERREIEQRPTRSLAAFLAYSRGLMAEDAGNFDEASRQFQDAFRLDPGFTEAGRRSASSAKLSAGLRVSAATIEAQTAGTVEGEIADAATRGTVAMGIGELQDVIVSTVIDDVNPTQAGAATALTTTVGGKRGKVSAPGRDGAGESTGNDRPIRPGRVIIVVPIPGNTPR